VYNFNVMVYLKILPFFFFLLASFNLLAQNDILLNELVAKNKTSYLDESGDAGDWLELYNPSNDIINLDGYKISDGQADWIFPKIAIAPKEYLVIFASDKDISAGDFLHTNFKLSSEGELLTLTDASGKIIDKIEYPNLKEDESYGRSLNDIDRWRIYTTPTPNQANTSSLVASDLISLHSSQQSGFYPDGVKIYFPTVDAGQTIRYTLDGSIPKTTSNIYNIDSGISLEQTVDYTIALIPTSDEFKNPEEDLSTAAVLRAAIFEGNIQVSEVLSQTFWLSANPHTIPIVSLLGEERDFFDEETGIYVKGNNENYLQKTEEWERPIHVSFYNQTGKFLFDQEAGIRLGGAKTRLEPQKTMRLYARSKYGQRTFEFPFWGEDYGSSFKRITLRTLNIGPWSKASIQDDLIHEIIDGEVNTDYVKRTFCVVYLNGVYWGIHSMREHNNQHFIENKYGVDEDDVIVARATVNASDTLNFDRLVHDIQFMDLNKGSNFNELASRLDIPQYFDYMITNIAFANRDWPQNNVEYWYSSSYDGKLRFIINDMDAAMTISNDERLDVFIAEQAVRLERDKWFGNIIFLQKLLEVPSHRMIFNQRLNEFLHTTFAPARTIPILQSMVQDLEKEMQTHISRWHHPNNINQWKKSIDRLEDFLLKRPVYLINRSNVLFGFPMETYPNPARDQFYLEFDAWADGDIEINIFDVNGKLVLQQKHAIVEGDQKLEVQTETIAAGAYILVAQFQNLTINKILIKVEAD
jgi:hypothetical protein